jgi:hypothetical protein
MHAKKTNQRQKPQKFKEQRAKGTGPGAKPFHACPQCPTSPTGPMVEQGAEGEEKWPPTVPTLPPGGSGF